MRLTPRLLRSCTTVLLAIAFGACSGGEPPTAPPTHGSIRTTIVTIGGDPDNDGYDLSVGPIARQPLPSNATVTNDVLPGTHSITIERVAENCSVSGPNPRTVTVAAGARVDVAIEVVCVATGIEVTARTAGAEYAPNHYVSLNNQWAGTVGANTSVVISRLEPGTYTVSLDLPGDHCRISGSHPLTIEVKARTIMPVSFEIACVPPTRVEQIAYSDGEIIRIVNSDGTGDAVLVGGHSPSWSPDGSRLVFSDAVCDYYRYSCTGGVAIFDLATKTVRRLENAEFGFAPAWAPVGDAIAFIDPGGQLAVATLDTSPAVLLATPGIQYSWSPSWSPDGQRIVFSCYPSEDLCVINKDGTKLERLTSGPSEDRDPAWGPHGRVVFNRRVGQDSEIVILDPDGRLTAIADGLRPAWSRDGFKVVFSGADGLFIVDADGRNATRLTTGKNHDPAWRP